MVLLSLLTAVLLSTLNAYCFHYSKIIMLGYMYRDSCLNVYHREASSYYRYSCYYHLEKVGGNLFFV